MEKISIQFVSDLHLEFYPEKYPEIIPTAPNIALCGDIGSPTMSNYDAFLNYLSKQYLRVFLVPGNHEYYSKNYSLDKMQRILRNLTLKYSNVYLLDNSSIEIDGLTIIGSTLWSWIPPLFHANYKTKINNYKKIHKINLYGQLIPLTPKDTNFLHKKAVDYITDEIEKCQNCIILTHYPPLYDGKKSTHCKGVEMAYYNHLPKLFNSKVRGWIYGHTHEAVTYRIKNTIVTSNPSGYYWEKLEFDPTLKIEIDLQLIKDTTETDDKISRIITSFKYLIKTISST